MIIKATLILRYRCVQLRFTLLGNPDDFFVSLPNQIAPEHSDITTQSDFDNQLRHERIACLKDIRERSWKGR